MCAIYSKNPRKKNEQEVIQVQNTVTQKFLIFQIWPKLKIKNCLLFENNQIYSH